MSQTIGERGARYNQAAESASELFTSDTEVDWMA